MTLNLNPINITEEQLKNEASISIQSDSIKDNTISFETDIQPIVEKYYFDYLIFIYGGYGFELEKAMFINGDKRNNIDCQ